MKGQKEKEKQVSGPRNTPLAKTQVRDRQCSREQGQLPLVLLKHDKGGS